MPFAVFLLPAIDSDKSTISANLVGFQVHKADAADSSGSEIKCGNDVSLSKLVMMLMPAVKAESSAKKVYLIGRVFATGSLDVGLV